MLIKTLTRAAGRFNFDAGEVIELPDEDAEELIRNGSAVSAEEPKESKASKPPKGAASAAKAKDSDKPKDSDAR